MKGKEELNYPSTLVIVAALNEEEGIGLTLAELKSVFWTVSCGYKCYSFCGSLWINL